MPYLKYNKKREAIGREDERKKARKKKKKKKGWHKSNRSEASKESIESIEYISNKISSNFTLWQYYK